MNLPSSILNGSLSSFPQSSRLRILRLLWTPKYSYVPSLPHVFEMFLLSVERGYQPASLASISPQFNVACVLSPVRSSWGPVFILGSRARTSLGLAYQVQTCLTFKVLIIWLHPTLPNRVYLLLSKLYSALFSGRMAQCDRDLHVSGDADVSILESEHAEFEKL